MGKKANPEYRARMEERRSRRNSWNRIPLNGTKQTIIPCPTCGNAMEGSKQLGEFLGSESEIATYKCTNPHCSAHMDKKGN